MTKTKIVTLGIAFILCGGGALATSAPSAAQVRTVAQTTPEPSPMPASTTEPSVTAPTPVNNPLPSTNMPAGATIDLKHGGIQGNSNGDNWIEKFNRKPGPDSSMEGVNTKYMHPGAPGTVNIKTKVKIKKTPPKPM
ncbi:MAG: hypothetical protein ABR584_01635 [Candidatus Baltobacteraceae bacterium]